MTDTPDTPAPAAPAEPKTTQTATTQPEALGDGGTRALNAERTARREAEKAAATAGERIAELERGQALQTVATAHELTPAQAALLTGATEEELDASAAALIAAFAPEPDPGPRRMPRENLRTGATHSTEPADSVSSIADSVMRR